MKNKIDELKEQIEKLHRSIERNRIKVELIRHMIVTGDTYHIQISAEKWHEIFKTKEL